MIHIQHPSYLMFKTAGERLRRISHAVIFFLCAAVAPVIAHAGSCGSCDCEDFLSIEDRMLIYNQNEETRIFITDEFSYIQTWIIEDFFIDDFLPALRMMAEQLVTNAMTQMVALGTLFDAKDQLDALRLFQERSAEAHKDYQTSQDMCVFGTAAMHLASADTGVRLAAQVISQHTLDRQLGTYDTAAAQGPEFDAVSRLANVQNLYCNPHDNFNQSQFTCGAGGPLARRNRDIDYGRIMGDVMTLNFNASDAVQTNDETDVFALSNYLYANHPFSRIPLKGLTTTEGQATWMDARAMIAKREVAVNSFSNIVAMKAASPAANAATAQYLAIVMERMGVGKDDAQKMVGGMDNAGNALNTPSYYAMLQILSQSIYQTPSFFANLYDTPVNVTRKDVAMQAINLMLDRDKFKSELRTEGLLAQLLEMEVVKRQEDLGDDMRYIQRIERTNPPP